MLRTRHSSIWRSLGKDSSIVFTKPAPSKLLQLPVMGSGHRLTRAICNSRESNSFSASSDNVSAPFIKRDSAPSLAVSSFRSTVVSLSVHWDKVTLIHAEAESRKVVKSSALRTAFQTSLSTLSFSSLRR